MIGIYKITSPTNRIYIGQSIHIEKRWDNYQRLNCKNQTKLYNSLKFHGVDNHKFEIVEECLQDNLLERETYYKKLYKVLEISSLCCRIDGRFGSLSQETKDKISEGLKGITRTEKTKKRIGIKLSKKLYQYNLNGNLIRIWNSCQEAELNNKGNIKKNYEGKILKTNTNFIFLKENEIYKLEERLDLIKNKKHKNKGNKWTDEHKKLHSQNTIGKKKNSKQNNLILSEVKEKYEYMSLGDLSKSCNLSITTMLIYLKENNLYHFRKNYRK